MGKGRYVIEYGETKIDLEVMAADLEEKENQLRRQIEELDKQRSMLSGLIDKAKRQRSKELWTRPDEALSPDEKLERQVSGLAKSTRGNYLSAFKRADAFFQGVEISDQRLADYLEYRYSLGLSPGAIDCDIRALKFRALAMDLENPFGKQSKAVMKKIRREGASRARGKAKALLQGDVDKIVSRCESERSLAGLRDSAMVCLMFECLLRIGEAGALQVDDLKPEPDGTARLHIRQSKTDQSGNGTVLFVGAPVYERVRVWLEAAGIESGPIFRKVEKSGRLAAKGLTSVAVRMLIKKRARQCGIQGQVSGHSLRRGMAQSLTESGEPLQAVADAGRWKNPAMVVSYVKSRAVSRGAVARRYSRA